MSVGQAVGCIFEHAFSLQLWLGVSSQNFEHFSVPSICEHNQQISHFFLDMTVSAPLILLGTIVLAAVEVPLLNKFEIE